MWTNEKTISERRRREPTNFVELFKILRFNQQFSENHVFDGKFYARQAGEWLQIHTRQSKISLAMASVAGAYFHPWVRKNYLMQFHISFSKLAKTIKSANLFPE